MAGRLATTGRLLFVLPMPIFGIRHLLYTAFVARWIPVTSLAYFTGTAPIGTGLVVARHMKTRIFATLLGMMFFLWVLTLHIPRNLASTHDEKEGASGLVALAMSGCAWLIAGAAYEPR